MSATYAPVRNLMLYLTEDCNLRCTYCFVHKTPRRMTSETARQAVDFYLDRNVSGVEFEVQLTFFGGEPFMEMDRMEEVIAYAREPRPNVARRVHFAATTNGTVATQRVERIVRDARMALLVSMDGGHGAGAHRPFVNGRSSYEMVARNLPRLVSWTHHLAVRMTFHPRSLDLLANVRHAFELGAPVVALAPVVEADWSGSEDRLEAAYQELADWYVSEARQGRLPYLLITHQFLQALHTARRGGSRPLRPCSVGHGVLGVDPDGNVMPCHRFLYRPQDWLGKVSSSGLSEQRERYLHLSSHDILGCNTCLAKSMCGGGCRVVALNAGYDLASGAHPGHCLLTRAHARAAIRIYDTLMAEQNATFLGMLTGPLWWNGTLSELATR